MKVILKDSDYEILTESEHAYFSKLNKSDYAFCYAKRLIRMKEKTGLDLHLWFASHEWTITLTKSCPETFQIIKKLECSFSDLSKKFKLKLLN